MHLVSGDCGLRLWPVAVACGATWRRTLDPAIAAMTPCNSIELNAVTGRGRGRVAYSYSQIESPGPGPGESRDAMSDVGRRGTGQDRIGQDMVARRGEASGALNFTLSMRVHDVSKGLRARAQASALRLSQSPKLAASLQPPAEPVRYL